MHSKKVSNMKIKLCAKDKFRLYIKIGNFDGLINFKTGTCKK